MMSIVDTHCHIDLDVFDHDRDEIIRAALNNDVHALVAIGFNAERWRSTAALCRRFPFIVRAAGLHPNDAQRWKSETLDELRRECSDPSVVAVGETGLDFFRDRAGKQEQLRAFEAQLELAGDLGLPVVIHQREAESEVLDALKRHVPLTGVMHCFTGDERYAESCLELGMMIGVGGVLTYPRSNELRRAIQLLPSTSIIVETDAPFLAPQIRRGSRNTPGNVRDIVETLAEIRGETMESTAAITTQNAIRLFGPVLGDAVGHGQRVA